MSAADTHKKGFLRRLGSRRLWKTSTTVVIICDKVLLPQPELLKILPKLLHVIHLQATLIVGL